MSRLLKLLIGLILLSTFLFLGWLFRDPLLQAAGEYLIVRDFPEKAEAIVVLSGESPDRAMGALDLYRQKLSSRILLTQELITPVRRELKRRGVAYPSSAELDSQLLQRQGVSEKDILLLEPGCDSTFSEAVTVKSFFGTPPPKRILLVTSRFHSRRARAVFRQVLGGDTAVLSLPTPYDSFDARSWWKQRSNIRNFLFEYQKNIFYHLSLFWDWIDPWKSRW